MKKQINFNFEKPCKTISNTQNNSLMLKPILQKKKPYSIVSGFGLVLLTLFSFGNLQAQKHNTTAVTQQRQTANLDIKGIVAEDGDPLPGVNILLEGTARGTTTDFNGNFKFPGKLKNGDVLLFSYIGMESQKVIITKDTKKLNVGLNVNLKMDTCVITCDLPIKRPYRSKK